MFFLRLRVFLGVFGWLLCGLVLPANTPEDIAEEKGPRSEDPARAVYIEADSLEMTDRGACVRMMDKLHAMHVDEVYVEVLRLGQSYYRSHLVPRALEIEKRFPDPLITVIKEARRDDASPIKVYAVVDPLLLNNGFAPVSPPEDHLLRTHPEWKNVHAQGATGTQNKAVWLDPGVPDVRSYLGGVVKELAGNYPLDGIHFIGMRYPDTTLKWGYSRGALRSYQRTQALNVLPQFDNPEWRLWRQQQLSLLLEELAKAAREQRPGINVSVSVNAEGHHYKMDEKREPVYRKVLQDWPGWCYEGIVDRIVVENYRSQKNERGLFLQWIDYADKIARDCELVIGVSGRINFDSDVVAQIRQVLARRADGVLLHSFQFPARDPAPGSDILAFLGNTLFSPGYELPPEALTESRRSMAMSSVNLPDSDLPPPIPLVTADFSDDVSAKERTLSQADAARALLGIDDRSPLRPSSSNQPDVDWRAMEIPEPVFLPGNDSKDSDDGPAIIVELKDGVVLKGFLLDELPGEGIRMKLSGRLAAGTVLKLPSTRIKSLKIFQ